MKRRREIASIAPMLLGLAFATQAFAQTGGFRFQGSFEAVADCESPVAARNVPVHGTASGVLNANKTATADLQLVAGGASQVHFSGVLGHSTAAPGGSARVRIVGRNHLQLVWDLPNNLLVTDIVVSGRSCSANLNAQLKPGRREYTIYHLNTYYYCSRIRVVSASCQIG